MAGAAVRKTALEGLGVVAELLGGEWGVGASESRFSGKRVSATVDSSFIAESRFLSPGGSVVRSTYAPWYQYVIGRVP